MTFNRTENYVRRLEDGLSHVVLGNQGPRRYLRLCGGYMDYYAEVMPPSKLITCLFCWRRSNADVLR